MTLLAQMRDVLAKLEAVSYGTTQGFEPIASKGGFGDRDGGTGHPPGGSLKPAHEMYANAWNEATTDEQRQAVFDEARSELDRTTRRTVPESFTEKPELPHERVARLLKLGEGIPLNEAAYRLRCSPSELRDVRNTAGRDAQTGRLLPERPSQRLKREERQARVRELADRGLSARQIGQIIQCHHTTVAADLRKAA